MKNATHEYMATLRNCFSKLLPVCSIPKQTVFKIYIYLLFSHDLTNAMKITTIESNGMSKMLLNRKSNFIVEQYLF